nr:hypothetical protein [uncultured Dysosmobacter sp.]
MTELMQVLYDYTLNTGFTAILSCEEYRSLNALLDRLGGRLRQELAADTWDTLTKYQDALAEQRDTELEAMFRATYAMCKELR